MRVRMTVVLDVPDEGLDVIDPEGYGDHFMRQTIRETTKQVLEVVPVLKDAGATIVSVH